MEEGNKTPRKNWDLMIGTALVLLGSFRLYNRLKDSLEINVRVVFTIGFIIYGGYLILKYFRQSDNN